VLYQAKNGTIPFGETTMEYIRFGTGKKTLIMLPGLGDGLRSMKGTALPMALMYRCLTKDYTVYAFSRLNHLPEGYTTRDMAKDQVKAMDALGIEKADYLGVSMGGMIAQHLAADHPERVGRLVLVVTAAQPNPVLTASVEEWICQAEAGDHTALMDSNVRKIYSQDYYRKNKWLVPIMGKLTRPKSYGRFFVQARACLTHDSVDRLQGIFSPTLVMGGGQDQTLGVEASKEIAGAIPDAQLKIYEQWGHGLYEEEKNFLPDILAFLEQNGAKGGDGR